MMNFVDWEHVNRSVLARQHLSPETKCTDVVSVARDVAGLHATSATTPYLSLFARVRGFEKAYLDRALYGERLLARIRCVRKTIFVHSKDLLPIVIGATGSLAMRASRRYMGARGITAAEYSAIAGEIKHLLAGREMTARAIRSALDTDVDISAVLYLMCDEAVLVRGQPVRGWRDRTHRYALFSEWLPDVELGEMDEGDAIVALVRRYLAAFGPAEEQDVVWWTGLAKAKVRRALAALAGELVEVRVRNVESKLLMLRSDASPTTASEPPARPAVSLLPILDPYLMGYRKRQRYLDDVHRDWVFDRAGNATSTILIDGRVAGVWDTTDAPFGKPVVKLFLLRQLSKDERDLVVSEAEAVGRNIFDRDAQIRECERMVPLTERTAGSMMSPLKQS